VITWVPGGQLKVRVWNWPGERVAELDARRDGETGDEIDVPPGSVVDPEVDRNRCSFERSQPPEELCGSREGGAEERARESIRLASARCDSKLVGDRGRIGADSRDAVVLEHVHSVEHRILQPPLCRHGGRSLPKPDELRVRVGKARARGLAFVEDRVDVRKPGLPGGLRPHLPGLRDQPERLF